MTGIYTRLSTAGRSEAWLSRGLWEAEIPGSNPGAPISESPATAGDSALSEPPRVLFGFYFRAAPARRGISHAAGTGL
jgi:hypothetical protein